MQPAQQTETSSQSQVETTRLWWFQRICAIFALILFASTWKLWSPQEVYPQVPLFAFCDFLPHMVDWFAFGLVCLSTLGCVLFRGRRQTQIANVTFILGLATLFLTDQHRLQPWAFQLLVIAIIFASCDGKRATKLLQLLAISIYVYSALGKFHYEFLHTIGQQFLSASMQILRIPDQFWAPTTRLVAASMFPVIEVSIGVGLCFQRTRKWSTVLAVLMHGWLIVLLGPWGIRHQVAVLVWNAFFIAQAITLFWFTSKSERTTSTQHASSFLEKAGSGVVCLVLLLPLLEPFGWYDHWLAWGLYSPHNSRVHLYVDAAKADSLPPELQNCLEVSQEDIGQLRIRMDRWSLDTLACPIYPQSRFQLGVALAIANRYELDTELSAEKLGMASRFRGARTRERLQGKVQLSQAASGFLFNARPRSNLARD